MSRQFAGRPAWQHRALVLAAIEEKAEREGIPRQQAATEILDQEYEWRRQELAAGRYTPVQDFARALGQLARRILRRR